VEELGANVEMSPFARVIRSRNCAHLALFSPMLALERKWCCFEFSVAKEAGKRMLMITAGGVVQKGHVAPVDLMNMAEKVRTFDSEKATCLSPTDSTMIDQAVHQRGGYEVLNTEVIEAFRDAIEDANACSAKALQVLTEAIAEDVIDAELDAMDAEMAATSWPSWP